MRLIGFLTFLLVCSVHAADRVALENANIRRVFSTEGRALRTVEITNRLTGVTITPDPCPEFQLRLSKGTDRTGVDTEVRHEIGKDGTLRIENRYTATR